MRDPIRFPGALLAQVLLAGAASAQSTWYVDAAATGPGSGTAAHPFQSIQVAIDQAATVDGDTVLVSPGTYFELVDLRDKELVLRSSDGPEVTTIDVTTVFSMEQSGVKIRGGQGPACRLEGFTVVGGEGTLLVEPVQGWSFYAGGGLLVVGSSPTIVDCILRDNTPDIGGGACVIDGEPVFVRCQFLENRTFSYGGALHASNSKVALVRCVASHNRSLAGNCGGVHFLGGSLSMQGGLLASNLAGSGGQGANLVLRFGALADLVGVSIADGHCDGNGGAVWIEGSDAHFEDCAIYGNSAGFSSSNREGGALYAEGSTIELLGCTATDNQSSRGGAVFLQDCVGTIEDSRFVGNRIHSGSNFFWAEGGALGASNTTLTIARTVFERNAAINASPSAGNTIARGGALWCDTDLVQVEGCRFLGNEAYYDAWASPFKVEPAAQGGAVFGPALIRQSTFVGNRAHSEPGSLSARAEGGAAWGARLESCSFTGNAVAGVGPVPDTGPAAEASTVVCCQAAGNLPARLGPFGPLCQLIQCP